MENVTYEFTTEMTNIPFAAVIVMLLVCLGLIVLMIAAYWKLFTKAGNRGWKILIPFYNEYTLTKIIWRPAIFWIEAAMLVLADVFIVLSLGSAIVQFSIMDLLTLTQTITASAYSVCFLIASLVLALAYAVIEMIKIYKLSKAYGHGIGYFFGILFLPVIFIPIMAFGKSQYCKNA